MTAKMSAEEQFQKHIEKLRLLVGKLGTIGAPVSEDQCKIALLRSFAGSYESLVATLENLIDNLNVEDIHGRIIREEAHKSNLEMTTSQQQPVAVCSRQRR